PSFLASDSASTRGWKGPNSARNCSVESQAIQKVSLYAICLPRLGSRSRLALGRTSRQTAILIVQLYALSQTSQNDCRERDFALFSILQAGWKCNNLQIVSR